jgi:hypothetical protein
MRSLIFSLFVLTASCGIFSQGEPLCINDQGCPPEKFCRIEMSQCVTREVCDNELDDDQDQRVDCEDADCVLSDGCQRESQLTRIELGEFFPGEEIPFPVPEGAIGFTLTAVGSESTVIGVSRLVDPSGGVRVNGFEDKEMRQFSAYGAIGFVFPQGDNYRNQMESGVWHLTLGASEQEPISVSLWLRTGPDTTGSFTVSVYLPQGLRMCENPGCSGGAGSVVTTDNAASFAEMRGLMHTLSEEVLEPNIGIAVGDVLFHSIDESFLQISSREEMDAMMRESRGEGLHLFLVQGFSGDYFSAMTAGVSSGIPGAIHEGGVSNSGVVVKVSLDPDFSGNINGLVAAHEIGHFLGLWHTTERDGTTDLLSDTPRCSLETFTNNLLECPDRENLMFPMVFGGIGDLSEAQAEVLRVGAGYR